MANNYIFKNWSIRYFSFCLPRQVVLLLTRVSALYLCMTECKLWWMILNVAEGRWKEGRLAQVRKQTWICASLRINLECHWCPSCVAAAVLRALSFFRGPARGYNFILASCGSHSLPPPAVRINGKCFLLRALLCLHSTETCRGVVSTTFSCSVWVGRCCGRVYVRVRDRVRQGGRERGCRRRVRGGRATVPLSSPRVPARA